MHQGNTTTRTQNLDNTGPTSGILKLEFTKVTAIMTVIMY